jgi:hypothetical protein|tara:strand:- start:110 stop:259 length:150 start_codon:yes stop_codon:yes gene_type:complete
MFTKHKQKGAKMTIDATVPPMQPMSDYEKFIFDLKGFVGHPECVDSSGN